MTYNNSILESEVEFNNYFGETENTESKESTEVKKHLVNFGVLERDLNKIKLKKNKVFNTLNIKKDKTEQKLIFTQFGTDEAIQVNMVTHGLDYDISESLNINVDYYEFLEALKSVHDITELGNILETDETATIEADYLNYNLEYDNVDYNELIVKPDFEFNLEVPRSQVKDLINNLVTLSKFRGENSFNANTLDCIQVKSINSIDGNNKIQFNAIDGFRIYRCEYSTNDSVKNYELLMKPKLTGALISILRNNSKNDLNIKFAGNKEYTEITVETPEDTIKIVGSRCDQTFFDTDSLINQKYKFEISFDKTKLNKTLELIKKDKEKNNLAIFDIKDNNLTIRNKRINSNFKIDTNEEFITGFNSGYLIDCLKNIKDNEILIRFYDEINPLKIIDNNKNYENTYLVLPIRVNE